MPGLRIGWVASRDRDLLARMEAAKDFTTICSSAPSELLARIALKHREHFAERSRGIVRENVALLDAFFGRHAERFGWVHPTAGSIAFPAVRSGSATAFHREVLEGCGVLIAPGTLFDAEDDTHFRIGYGRRSMPEALDRLEEYLRGGEIHDSRRHVAPPIASA
jgi:aspartate/methionine/tyrosine aminotransferase